jgi:ubiquitin-conjugating enzyme E2 D/E
MVPPKVDFLTPIYHPNIQTTTSSSTAAKICLEILDPSKCLWSPAMTIQRAVLSIACLLADPNPNDPLVPDIGKEMLRDRKKWEQKAKLWTYQHAK